MTMTPEEIHAIGLKEMEGIHAEMLEQMKASGFTGTFAEFLKFLSSDPQFYAKTAAGAAGPCGVDREGVRRRGEPVFRL